MRRLVFCCTIALASLSAAASAEPGQLDVNGQTRTFLLERPTLPGPRPTVIMLHGGGSDAEQEMRVSGLAELGPREGFAVVFPDGRGKLWNFFPPGRENRQYVRYLDRFGGLPDDVAFLKLLMADLVQRGISDPKRIYLGGRSLGGTMSLRLACVDASKIAAIGLLIAAMPEVVGSDCRPFQPVPLLTINGTDDRVLPYRGERDRDGYVLWPTPQLVAFFRELGGCKARAEAALPDRVLSNVFVESWTNCSAGHVVHYRIVDGGHEIPAGLNTTQVLLDFFREKTK